MMGLGLSPPLIPASRSPSSVASRFRLVDELTEAGEPERDAAATPLTGAAATSGEAMPGEEWDSQPEFCGFWLHGGWRGMAGGDPGLSRRIAFAKGGCSVLGTSSKKFVVVKAAGQAHKFIQTRRINS